jgi:hypothetical protein
LDTIEAAEMADSRRLGESLPMSHLVRYIHLDPQSPGAAKAVERLSVEQPETVIDLLRDPALACHANYAQLALDAMVTKGFDAYLGAWNSLPATIQQYQATTGLAVRALRLAELEPKRVSEWVRQLPTPARDAAIPGLVRYLQSPAGARDHEAAAVWAASMRESPQRSHQLKEVYESWRTAVGDAAAAINGSQLPENLKTTLLGYGK